MATFLEEGFELEELEDDKVDVPIVQAEDDGPTFTAKVRLLPIKEYRKVFAKLNQQGGGFRQNKAAQDKVDKDYLERVVKGWEGLTVDNWNAICRDGNVLKAPEGVKPEDAVVKFSQEALFYLYRNTWPQDFGNKVFDVVQEGAAALEAEEEDLD